MQIHEITKRQINEGILGDLKAEVTKQATDAYKQAAQGVQKFKADPMGTIKQAASNAYQKYATPAGQLKSQQDSNAASAALSANKIAMQFGAPLYQEFVTWQKSQPAEPVQPETTKQEPQQSQPEQKPLTPAEEYRRGQEKQMSVQSGIKEADETVSSGGIVIPAGAKTANAPANQQTPKNLDPFSDSIKKFVDEKIGDTSKIEELPVYSDQYNDAIIAAVKAFEQNKPAEQKRALTYAFGIAKLAAMKLKKEAEGGSQSQSQTSGRTGRMSDEQVDKVAAAIKQVSGGAKGNPTGVRQVDALLTKAGVLGEGKQ